MRWFKHFTDNHRGRSIQSILDAAGHQGLTIYILMEICAEKLERNHDRELAESDCEFIFNRKYLGNILRMKWKSTQNVLGIFQECNLLRWECSENEVRIKMPILLDLLDYDQRRSRQRRVTIPPQIRLELESESDKDIKNNKKEIIALLTQCYEIYPRKVGKQQGFKKLKAEIKTLADANLFRSAVEKYRAHVAAEKTEAKFIKHFSSFVSSWRDWLDADTGKAEDFSAIDWSKVFEEKKNDPT